MENRLDGGLGGILEVYHPCHVHMGLGGGPCQNRVAGKMSVRNRRVLC